jgi:Predicted Zn peptidase
MTNSQTYRDIFNDDFIAQINDLSKNGKTIDIGSLPFDGEQINIEEILNELGYKIRREAMPDGSGQLNGSEIVLDNSEAQTRQRFTMAHELSHALNGENGEYRRDNPNSYPSDKKRLEIKANRFAAAFLMPKPIVTMLVEKEITERNFNSTNLSKNDVDLIITSVAERMNVSKIAMTNRVHILHIFTEV